MPYHAGPIPADLVVSGVLIVQERLSHVSVEVHAAGAHLLRNLAVVGVTKDYSRINGTHERLRKKYNKLKSILPEAERKTLLKQMRKVQLEKLNLPLYPVHDTAYKRIQYNRYADDFVIGVIGSKADAEQIKTDVGAFLSGTLHLTLSDEKTKVTHSAEPVRYLGYDFCVSRDKSFKRTRNGCLQRLWYNRVKLTMPHEKWFGKLLEYGTLKIKRDKSGSERWKVIHRGYLMNSQDIEIISRFNSEIRGIYNYYRLAQNVSTLDKYAHIMKRSLHKTFAGKYRTTVSEIKKKYVRDGIFGVDYMTKDGAKRCELYHDGFVRNKDNLPDYTDVLPQYRRYQKQNGLAMRLKRKVCELCGEPAEDILMHHVRRLKDLGSERPSELLMKRIRRKSLALCPACFMQVKAGQL